MPPLGLEEERQELAEDAGDDGAPELKMPPISAVATSVSESCVWNVIARGTPDLRREQAAGDAGR